MRKKDETDQEEVGGVWLVRSAEEVIERQSESTDAETLMPSNGWSTS